MNYLKQGLKLPILLFILLTLSSSCSINSNDEITDEKLNGVWKSKGYGYLFNINDSEVDIYELTSISCVKSGLQSGPLRSGGTQNVDASFDVEIPGFIESEFKIKPGNDDDQKYFQRIDVSTPIETYKITALPTKCTNSLIKSNSFNLSVFQKTFQEHYAFFEQRLGGSSHFTDANNDVHIANDADLFSSLVRLIEPLNDPHNVVVAEPIESFYFGGDDESIFTRVDMEQFLETLDKNYLKSPLTYYGHENIGFGVLKEDLGYLQINGFMGFADSDNFGKNLSVLNNALDKIFQESSDMNGLVIDLRFNGGGSDSLSLAVAARLTSQAYLAYNKKAFHYLDGRMEWTKPLDVYVEPSDMSGYFGDIVLLTDKNTLSAAEIFTLALMNRTPQVIRIGDRTRGAFSDILPRKLPNGWLFGLSNEQYADEAGTVYEVTGIPPHIAVDMPTFLNALNVGKDITLERAIEQLIAEEQASHLH